MNNRLKQFIERKIPRPRDYGFEVSNVNQNAFDWQQEIIKWAVRRGRAALFEGCGLGKTIQQLEWCRQVFEHTDGMVMLHCPVGVRHQTAREAEKFGIDCPVTVPNEQSEARPGINIVNYEKLHRFTPRKFPGVALDESSILKGIDGKIKAMLIEAYQHCDYRLSCTATPAPNDFPEFGQQVEFLGICSREEMLATYFVHDSGDTSKWRLRKHGVKDFWDWMAGWAICIDSPADIGFSDEGFKLPPLKTINHYIEPEEEVPDGFLFDPGKNISATEMHAEKRKTAMDRARVIADIALSYPSEPFIAWCHSNDESAALKKLLPDAHEIRGSDSDSSKERKLLEFSDGTAQRCITKPTIAGFGMNWQHCRLAGFIGLTHSFEQYHQAIHRIYRFGQLREVEAHIVSTPAERAINDSIHRKIKQHEQMRHGMAMSMRTATIRELRKESRHEKYNPTEPMRIPKWLIEAA